MYADRTPKEQHYYGCITALDEQVGRLRRELRDLGIADDTMLWFCSDNGPEGQARQAPGSAGPFRGRKRDLWEGGIRVPGMLEWPAAVKGPRAVSMPCVTTDYLPTVLDYLGLAPDASRPIDGISLRPLIEGTMAERPAPIGFEFGNMAAWIDNRYKLVALLRGGGADADVDEDGRPADPSGNAAREGDRASQDGGKAVVKSLLFDIVADPKEETDLSADQPAARNRCAPGSGPGDNRADGASRGGIIEARACGPARGVGGQKKPRLASGASIRRKPRGRDDSSGVQSRKSSSSCRR